MPFLGYKKNFIYSNVLASPVLDYIHKEIGMEMSKTLLISSFMTDKYYSGKIAKDWNPTSIPATEHSVMCANVAKQQAEGKGRDETETYRKLITELYPSGFVSIVSDTYDFWHNVSVVIPSLKEDIMKRDGRLVVRPDSGSPVDIICGTVKNGGTTPEEKGLIELLWDEFGGTINSKGYKVLDPHIGAIYGDSITLERAELIFAGLEEKGFASSNIVMGVGSYSYQGNTRDSLGFAIKATSVTQVALNIQFKKTRKQIQVRNLSVDALKL